MQSKLASLFVSLPVIAVLTLGAGGCGTVPAKASPDDPAGNFSQVSPTVYRGGRPDGAGVYRLAQMGIKTIIDLEDDDQAVATEKQWAANAGLNFIHAPMNGMETPRDDEVNTILAQLDDPSIQPIYVHCMEGVDRTGLIIALYRVIDEGWNPKDAHDEMMAHGFKSILISMNHYFETKTGWDD
jgi:uncharacterized protein (TIGR01244 family)